MMNDIQMLLNAGLHVGFSRTRRHPTASSYIFGTKDRLDIFNLEETVRLLERACAFVAELGASGKTLLLVGGKHEVVDVVRHVARLMNLPYVAGRWIGGTLTNFKNIRKRIDRLQTLMRDRESGELEKYTKRERLLIDREIDELLTRFEGLVSMTELPASLFVIDPRHEHTAVKEANQLKIPVIGLANSDCDFSLIQYPIPGNDTSIKSVKFVCERIAESYLTGARNRGAGAAKKSEGIVAAH